MSDEYVKLTEELAQVRAKEHEIQARLAAEREQVRTGLIESLKAHIEKYGFSVEDIATAMLPKGKAKRTAKGGTRAAMKPATVYVDKATGNTYSKGRVPDWLRAGMLAHQINPEDKGALKEYKAKHMTALEAEQPAIAPDADAQAA
jgi:DNA-binding protein H-NS